MGDPHKIQLAANPRQMSDSNSVANAELHRLEMPMRKATIILSLAATLAAYAARGESTPLSISAPGGHDHPALTIDPSLTIAEVVRRTADHEPGAGVVAAMQAEATALRRNASRLLAGAPALAANHVNDRLWSDDGYRQWDAGLELPLWWPGQRRGRREIARAADGAASHAKQVHLLEVSGWVRQAVAELALSRVRLELAEVEWHAKEALAAQVERAVELRELAERDLLLARSTSLEQRFSYLEALEELRHSEGNYSLLTGLSTWPADWSETAADRSAFPDHPQLLMHVAEAERATGEVRRLSGDQWGNPVFLIGTQHERDAGGVDFNDRIVAGVRIPLGRRGDAQADIAAARRALAEAHRDVKRLERNLLGRIAQTEHRLALGDERVTTAEERATIAREYLRLTERGFWLGETDLATLLRARASSIAAEQTYREALILRQFAAAELNQALGVVP